LKFECEKVTNSKKIKQMKIEKIKNFNQVILAIVGILGLILMLMLITSLASEIVQNRRDRNIGSERNTIITDGLISDEKIEKLNVENQRQQIISYESPELIDTVNTIYIIPISVSTLDKPETIPAPPELRSSVDFSYEKRERYYQENYFPGLFTNIIVYQPTESKTILLFNERIMLNRLRTYNFKDDILLVFFTAEKDTNNDGLINYNDDTNLCIYSLKTGKMRRISEGANSIINYKFIENSKDLLVEFSLSQYNDVKFNSYKPLKIMKYEFETEKLSEVVPANIQQQMRNLVEGKKLNRKQ